MVVQPSTGQLPRSSDVADFYHHAPIANEEHGPVIATALEILFTTTGSDSASMVALTKTLAELNAFTQSQAAEL
jgi:hypothetical protein